MKARLKKKDTKERKKLHLRMLKILVMRTYKNFGMLSFSPTLPLTFFSFPAEVCSPFCPMPLT